MDEILKHIHEHAQYLKDHSAEADDLGRLPDETVRRLREIGVVRMLQPRDFGGLQSHPADFYEAVIEVAAASPSAGWVVGVVGVHAYEFGYSSRQMQQELWGEDPDTWTASPYAPMGRAVRVGGGYRLTGRWPFSSGTDHASWVIIGGIVTDSSGAIASPPDVRHFVVEREDYEIHHDSWNVVGLRGTGSKDISVTDVFVPDHRVLNQYEVFEGQAARAGRPDDPYYHLPFGVMFSTAIAAATIGMAQGALQASVEYTRNRVNVLGDRVFSDPAQLVALGEAGADIAASRHHLLSDMRRAYDIVMAGGEIDRHLRLELRRNQVRASRRAVEAVEKLFIHAGGHSLHLDQPQQRYWRDAHAALNHLCNVAPTIYVAYGTDLYGGQIAPGIFH
ncbi:acyl-CoA dehydrogenase family protein [Streptomyces sp. NPDC052052]|uniref:acyl-CoA dehydrogenase family protein n=1 Tax=Streptomyces sp. NPDC052052 TaxID=3154756 RepID=UPI00342FBB55